MWTACGTGAGRETRPSAQGSTGQAYHATGAQPTGVKQTTVHQTTTQPHGRRAGRAAGRAARGQGLQCAGAPSTITKAVSDDTRGGEHRTVAAVGQDLKKTSKCLRRTWCSYEPGLVSNQKNLLRICRYELESWFLNRRRMDRAGAGRAQGRRAADDGGRRDAAGARRCAHAQSAPSSRRTACCFAMSVVGPTVSADVWLCSYERKV